MINAQLSPTPTATSPPQPPPPQTTPTTNSHQPHQQTTTTTTTSVAPLASCSASGFLQRLFSTSASAHTMSSGGFKVPQLKLGDKTPEGVDQAKYLKLGQRVSATLKDLEKGRYVEPKQLDPEEVLVDWCSRGGAPPHVLY